MKRHIAVLCLMFLPLFASAAEPRPAPTVEVVSAEFGVFDTSNPKETTFAATDVVPHREGQRYGWVIEVKTKRRSLGVSEEYLLPNTAAATPPDTDRRGNRVIMDVPLPRRNQVSLRELVPVDGAIYGEWVIGPGEPAGHRHLQVMIDGVPVADFEFDVGEVGGSGGTRKAR